MSHRINLSARKRWAFRLAAVALGLFPCLVFEAVCWLNGWGTDRNSADPFIAFSTTRPLFERTADETRWQITPSRQRFFSKESFPTDKPAGSRRLFVIGESTVAGEPFGQPTAFPTWLQRGLDVVDPASRWNVVNCGGVSYASYRLAPIVDECLTHEPDLIILAVGHNEFLEERTYAPIRSTPAIVRSLYDFAGRSRGFRVIRSQLLQSPGTATLPDELKTRLDYERGLADYHQDPAGRVAVIAHFEFNLRRMVRSVQAAGVPLILIRQPSNLTDCPPFKSEYDPRLRAADRERCEQLVTEAHALLAHDLAAAITHFEAAVAIDPTFARTQYELGKCYETQGDTARARTAFVLARDHDVCPLRMVSELEQVLQQVAAETGTPLVDLHDLLEAASPTGLLGGFLLVDHVHPSITGHQRIARWLLDELAARGHCPSSASHQADIDAAFAQHLASLDEHYYLRGQRTLRSLQAWAAGRAALTPTVSEPNP